jgi:hypothetical protein
MAVDLLRRAGEFEAAIELASRTLPMLDVEDVEEGLAAALRWGRQLAERGDASVSTLERARRAEGRATAAEQSALTVCDLELDFDHPVKAPVPAAFVARYFSPVAA